MKFNTKHLMGALLLTATLAQADCTQEEATNMMMALSPMGQELLNEVSALETSDPKKAPLAIKTQNYNTEMSQAGIMLGDAKYSEACTAYNTIASKYDLDLKELMKTSPTVASLSQSGSDGKCSLTDASTKLMGMISADPQLSNKEPKAFMDIQMNLASNPAKACDDMDQLIAKYSIEMEEPS